ncbi:MAG TPA: Xaa-Pro peptidase family protein [Actinomycetota bacterium]
MDPLEHDPDLTALREERLARLQASMAAHGVDGCLLFNEPNIRYATGASAMPVWSMSTFVRCALVPGEGDPILFEHPNSIHRSRHRAKDVRPMHAWEFYDDPAAEATTWAAETAAGMRELGIAGPLAVDRVGAPGFLALAAEGVAIVDSAPVTQEAREVKTPQEIRLFELNGRLISEALAEFEAAVVPGAREQDLLAVLASAVLRRGAEYLATSTCPSGPNTNPWRAEATGRELADGDLVFVDTDTVGVEGCFFCVSRTFLCGHLPATRAQVDAYRAAYGWLEGMRETLRPGLTCAEVAARAPRLPDRYLAQRYEVMVHSVGLEEESPSVAYPSDQQPNPDRVLREGMVLVAEVYAGEVGAGDGVKLGDELLLTDDGPVVLAPYPFEPRLL